MNWYKLAELTVTPREFQAKTYEGKVDLARNTSISSQTQQLFFTEKYDYKKHMLWRLAYNTSITLETQKLFFTGDYDGKDSALALIRFNPSFLKGLTLKEMREFTKTNKLSVYAKRLVQIKLLRL